MSIETHNSPQCPDCGAVIPPGQPKGLCATCALKGALGLSNGESQVLQSEDSASALSRQPATPVGQLPTLKYFGDYELLEEIARGGMGIVYKARQASLDRIVAVKLLLRGEYASEDFIKRFRIEASAAASLQHPNIVAIHEVGVHEGHHYFAMDLVDGPNLARLLRDGPLPARRAAGYVKTIAEAIHFAHTRQILHRDLKPSNVLIDSNDQPRVTDFGLARNLANDSDLTVSGQVHGTPSFMPPEQASGQRGKVGVTSDVYSLGAILYHALTGRPPFMGQSVAETLKQVENTEPNAPRLLNPRIPRDLETICLKCLQKEPGKRYSSAQELARELGRFLCDESIHAHPVGRPEKIWRWCRRKPAIAGMAAGIVLLALIGVAGWLVAKEKSAAAARAMVAKVKADEDAARETKQAAEILRANDEFLLRQAFTDTNNLSGPALLKALEVAISRQPTNFALWQAKTEVLKRGNRFEDALDNLSKAIERADELDKQIPMPTKPVVEVPDIDRQSALTKMLLIRSSLLREMNRQKEADLDYHQAGLVHCRQNGIGVDDSQTKPELLDLSPFYTSESIEALVDWGVPRDNLDPKVFAEQVHQITGVKFDLRGFVTMWALGEIKGIPVNQRFSRFHGFHGTWGTESDGTKIGAYVLHYADGEIAEIPIRYGEHLRDVWMETHRKANNAITAWTGNRLKNDGNNARAVQFFKVVLENPRPEEKVVAIDLVAFKSVCKPIFGAITLEQAAASTVELAITRAKEAEKHGDIAGALTILDEAVQTFPTSPGLWSANGGHLERANRTNEALEAFSRALALCAADTNAFPKVQRETLLLRSGLFLKMGRYPEAGLDNCRARDLPLRDPQTPPESLDLNAFYDGSMSFFLGTKYIERMNTFLLDVRQNTGVEFDARGYVALYGRGAASQGIGPSRRSVTGIPVNRHCTNLHFLHSAWYRERKGTRIGSYILRFADGQSEELPIIYEEHVREAWGGNESVTRAIIGWSGISDRPTARKRNTVFMAIWANPRPSVEVKSLDFVSAISESNPVLIGITVE